MKTIRQSLTLAAILFSLTIFAQTPQSFKYQTIVRDATGAPVQNQNVNLRFSIHNMNAAGPVVYSETHMVLTNEFGLASLEIGNGVPLSGTFSAIDWGTNSKYLEVELDPSGGNSFISMGTTQLMSVPYALFSENTANTNDADADPSNELNTSIMLNGTDLEVADPGGTITTDLSSLVDDADADPANELQNLSLVGNDLSISNGNTVTLPGSGINNRISDDDGNTWIDTETNANNDSIVFSTMGMERMVISHNGYVEVNGQMIATGFQGDGSGLTGVPGDDLGDHTATEELDMANHRIKNVVSPDDGTDAATKLYVDTQISLSGDNLGNHTATQNIALDSNWISNDGESEGIYIDAEGKVGVNTDFPDAELSVAGNIQADQQVRAAYGTASDASYRFGYGGENSGFSSPYYNSVSVITDGSERMTINDVGNVGIGTSTPAEMLHVEGTVRIADGTQAAGRILTSDADGSATWSDPGAPTADNDWEIVGDDMYSEVTGNVGVGTSTPDAKLEVAGHISQTATGNSTFIGEGAGENDDLTNNENVFVGKEAGSSNTSGSYNTATGYQSLQDNTDGDYNTAYGHKALEYNIAADGNTAIGYASLNKNTSGQSNTASGTLSLHKNISGAENTATGTQSLYNNTSGQSNSAFGYQALYRNEGDRNTAYGSQALEYQEGGNNNTAIGYEAGKGSSYHDKSGGVFIGHQAGKNETDDNKLYIENSSSSTPLIGGDFAADEVYLNGNVGIGTDSPTTELDVNGQVKASELEVNGPTVVNGQIQITGGDPGPNKVLTSDAGGTASWATTGGGGFQTNMATSYMNAMGMFTPHEDNCDATEVFVPIFMGATVGFCMEKDHRGPTNYYYALHTCLGLGKRLPEVYEYQHANINESALGFPFGSFVNWEFISNFPLRINHNYINSGEDYLGAIVMDGMESKIESYNFSSYHYRCVR